MFFLSPTCQGTFVDWFKVKSSPQEKAVWQKEKSNRMQRQKCEFTGNTSQVVTEAEITKQGIQV